MSKLILKDNTEITLEVGAGLGTMTAIFPDKAAMVAVWDKLTPANIASTRIQNDDGLTTGSFTDLVLLEPHMSGTEQQDGTIKAAFGFREKTDTERRLDALEVGQQTQDGAIEDVARVLSTVAEQMEGDKA